MTFIIKNPTLKDSQNYLKLRETGIKHIENLAHQIWTDYNVHDPGITVLELLCYAITDLGYRTGFDIKDILTEQTNGEAFIDDSNFHTAAAIFSSHPVTFNDLRKILIDITGVKQAWISINKNIYYFLDVTHKKLVYNPTKAIDLECEPLNGLYDVLIQKEDFVEEDERIAVLRKTRIHIQKFTPVSSFTTSMVPTAEGLELEVFSTVMLRAVYLNIIFDDLTQPADLTIRLWQENSGVFNEIDNQPLSFPVQPADLPQRQLLHFKLEPGIYRLTAEGVNLDLDTSAGFTYPTVLDSNLTLLSGFDGAANDNSYYFFNSLETVHVEDEGQNALNLDFLAPALPPNSEGVNFKVRFPVTIKSLAIYLRFLDPLVIAQVKLTFSKETNGSGYQEVLSRTVDIKPEDQPEDYRYTFILEESFEPGNWRVTAETINLELAVDATPPYPLDILGVIELTGGYDGTATDSNLYFLFDWEVTYAVSPVLQESFNNETVEGLTVGAADNSIGSGGAYIIPNSKGLVFNVLCPIQLQSISLYIEDPGDVKIELYDREDTLLESTVQTISTATVLTPITLDWIIPPGLHYRIRASKGSSTPIKLYKNDGFTSTFEYSNVVEIINGINGTNLNEIYYFFYDWQFSYTPCLPLTSEITLADIRKAVKNKLYINRNLCEDFINIQVLKTEEISVCMDLEVRPDVDLEATLAEIYYRLELHVSPPVNFYSIQELLDKGKTTDQIFEGPLLDHGFIDHDEFIKMDRRGCLRTSDIIQIIMDVEGVTAVKTIALLSFIKIDFSDIQPGDTVHEELNEFGVTEYYRVKQEEWILKLEDGNSYAPDFSPTRSKTFFYKNSLPYLANRAVVEELLQEKRAQQIRTKLRGHQADLPVPVGTFRDLEDYYPIQNDLPETYFTGQNVVPESQPKLRKAQSAQFKGYLLFFEQLLANYLSQLANVKDLFSWKKTTGFQSYFTQKLKEIAHIEGLYIPDYNGDLDTELATIIETGTLAGERKNKFLDHLIGRFSESLAEYGLMMHSLLKEEAAKRLIIDKQAFLDDYPRVSSERGKGFDYRFPKEYDNLTGFQRRVYRLLGIYDEACKVGRRNFASPRIFIPGDGVSGCYFFRILSIAPDNSDPLKPDLTDDFIFQSNCCSSKKQICILVDTLIAFGANEANWCKLDNGIDPDKWLDPDEDPFVGGQSWVLKRTCKDCDELKDLIADGKFKEAKEEILGFTPATITTEEDFTTLVLQHFKDYANREGFHVIENILLRKRSIEESDDFLPVEIHSDDEECQCVEVKDPYSFRASVILPSWPTRFRSTRFRQFIEKTLRQEAPAHVYLRICWINHCEMQAFEKCHDAWLQAHADLDCKFRGERELPLIASMEHDNEKVELEAYRSTLNDLIGKLYQLNNVFTVARIHGCDDVDGEEPQVSLNNTSLGSL